MNDASEPGLLDDLRGVVELAPAMLSCWHRDLRCRVANPSFARWFGRDPAAMRGLAMAELLGPLRFDSIARHVDAVLRGEPRTFELEEAAEGAGSLHTVWACVPRVARGEAVGFVAQVTDVTALKAAESALPRQHDTERRLRASEALLDRTGRIASVGGWQMDLRSGELTWSAQMRRIHDVGPDYQPRLAEALAFYAPEARAAVSAAIHEAIGHSTPWDLELPFVTAKGRSLWIRSFGEAEVEAGVVVRLSGAFQDVTEHRQRKIELQREQALRIDRERQVQDLDALLRERSEMLDLLAHEVRQPLNNASAALQSAARVLGTLEDTSASSRLMRAQAVMSQVLASIDNTLAVASLLARPDVIQHEDTDIDTLIAVAVADMAAGDRARVLVERITRTRTAAMDMSLMRLALRNLLANALKFSAPGSPVTVRLTDSDDPLALLIDVIDTGSGIEPALVPRLFERGARGSRGHGPMGHGLGLYIVRRVMELQSGRVSLADNSPGNVTMRLVLEQAPDT